MRVNIYAEEMTERIEIVEKDGFIGLRMYMYLPVTKRDSMGIIWEQVKGPFIHHEGDDDSSAITFWGKSDLRGILEKALDMLNHHYEGRKDEMRRGD